MNSRAYLQKQGWLGDGHSLDKSGKGIKKPLLVSKKVDVLGVGLNKHAAVSDQWWLRAFDESLKNFGSGRESVLATVQKHGVHRGGLYGRFVQGESIAGTFTSPPPPPPPSQPIRSSSADQETTAMIRTGEKRKTAEGPVEKRSRRKIEKDEKVKKSTKEKRERLEADVHHTPTDAMEGQSPLESAAPVCDFKKANRVEIAVPSSKKAALADVEPPSESKTLSTKKLANYQRRADEKGVSLEEYIKRRRAKSAVRRKGKKNDNDAARTPITEAKLDLTDSGIKVDPEGDSIFADNLESMTAVDAADFALQVTSAMRENRSISIVDPQSQTTFNWTAGQSIPLEPKIWYQIVVKELPRPVRKARRDWMAAKRGVTKAPGTGLSSAEKTKSRSARKVEEREDFVHQILHKARAALKSGDPVTHATIKGVENVPLITVKSLAGPFDKVEVSLARTAARRILRNEKRIKRDKVVSRSRGRMKTSKPSKYSQ